MDLLPNLKVFVHLQPGSLGDILNFKNLSVLPRITSFTFRATGISSSLFCRALALMGPTLEVLDISFNTLIAEGSSLIQLPVLHTLILGMNIGDGFQAFQLGFIARRWYTPRLEYIHGLDGVNGILNLGLGKDAFDDLDSPSSVRTIAITRRDFSGNIAAAFPLLENLVLDTIRPIVFRSPLPSCTRIGIVLAFHGHDPSQVSSSTARNKYYAGLLWDQFIPLMNPSTFPNLQLVRVFFKEPHTRTVPSVGSANVRSFFEQFEYRVFWRHWVNRWKTRGVGLEAVQDGVVWRLEDVHNDAQDDDTATMNVEDLALEYERIWEKGGQGDSSSSEGSSERSSRSSAGSEELPTAVSLQTILQS